VAGSKRSRGRRARCRGGTAGELQRLGDGARCEAAGGRGQTRPGAGSAEVIYTELETPRGSARSLGPGGGCAGGPPAGGGLRRPSEGGKANSRVPA